MADAPTKIPFGSTPIAPVAAQNTSATKIPFGSAPLTPVQPTPATTAPQTGFLSSLRGQVKGAFDSGVEQVKKGMAQGQTATNPLQAIESGITTGAGAINTVLSPLAPVFSPISKGVDAVANKISDIPAVQDFAQTKTGNITSRIAEDVGNLSTIAGTSVGLASSPSAAESAGAGLKKIPTIVSDIGDAAKTKLENRYVSGTVDDWSRIGGDYVKTDKLLSREQAMAENPNVPASVQDTPTFLAEHGIAPQSLIKDGKFDTTAVAEKLSGESIKPFEDALTKQLQVVQQGKPPVPIETVRQAVLSKIDGLRGETPDAVEAMKNLANEKLDAVGRKYPNGMPLDKLNIEKGNYWRKTKFDITKPLEPQINYQIGSAMKQVIEGAADDAQVTELNGVLGNYYKASKFLQGLNDKVPKLTTGQKIVRGVTKGVLTGVGEKAFGMSGGVGGFLLGKSVSKILESVSDPVRGIILRNLERTDPAAYTEAIKWLGQKEAERLARPLLPAPKPLGSSENPIITASPTTFEAPARKINREPGTLPALRAKGENPIPLK